MPPSDYLREATSAGALVSLRRTEPDPLPDPRRSDVDEWGRSESMRTLARTVYGPLYRNWFRVEWEGLEKIPTSGGALLVANHAAALPSDAPVIMHGVEEELGRAVYGLADHLFKSIPVVGTMWSRVGGVAAHPENAYRLLREQKQLVLVFPEGTKGTCKNYQRALPTPSVRPRRVRRDRDARRRARSSRSRSWAPKSRCPPSSGSTGWPRRSASRMCR